MSTAQIWWPSPRSSGGRQRAVLMSATARELLALDSRPSRRHGNSPRAVNSKIRSSETPKDLGGLGDRQTKLAGRRRAGEGCIMPPSVSARRCHGCCHQRCLVRISERPGVGTLRLLPQRRGLLPELGHLGVELRSARPSPSSRQTLLNLLGIESPHDVRLRPASVRVRPIWMSTR